MLHGVWTELFLEFADKNGHNLKEFLSKKDRLE
jgi:hypothetical protein